MLTKVFFLVPIEIPGSVHEKRMITSEMCELSIKAGLVTLKFPEYTVKVPFSQVVKIIEQEG